MNKSHSWLPLYAWVAFLPALMAFAFVPAWLSDRLWEYGFGQISCLALMAVFCGVLILRGAILSRPICHYLIGLGILIAGIAIGGAYHDRWPMTLGAVSWLILHGIMVFLPVRHQVGTCSEATIVRQVGAGAACVLVAAVICDLWYGLGTGRRSFGFGTGNINTLLYVMGIPALLALIHGPTEDERKPHLTTAVCVMGVIAAITLAWLTQRRGIGMVVIGGIAAATWVQCAFRANRGMRWSIITAGSVMGIAMAFMFVAMLMNDRPRWLLMQAGIDAFLQSPFWGQGGAAGLTLQDSLAPAARHLTATGLMDPHPHSEIVHALLSGGVVTVIGLAIMVMVMIGAVRARLSLNRRNFAVVSGAAMLMLSAAWDPSWSTPIGLLTAGLLVRWMIASNVNTVSEPAESVVKGSAFAARLIAAIGMMAAIIALWFTSYSAFIVKEAWPSVVLQGLRNSIDPHVAWLLSSRLIAMSEETKDDQLLRLSLESALERSGTLSGSQVTAAQAAWKNDPERHMLLTGLLAQRFPFHPTIGATNITTQKAENHVDIAAAQARRLMSAAGEGMPFSSADRNELTAIITDYADVESVALLALWAAAHLDDWSGDEIIQRAAWMRWALRDSAMLTGILSRVVTPAQARRFARFLICIPQTRSDVVFQLQRIDELSRTDLPLPLR